MIIREFSSREIDIDQIRAAVDGEEAVLLRGASFDASSFEEFTREICGEFHHVGTRQQFRHAGDGMTTEVFRGNFMLLGHSEGTYRPAPAPPDYCFFLCLVPPACAGGETFLVDGAEMVERLSPDVRGQLESSTITYECRWEPSRWQAEFQVATEREVLELLAPLASCAHEFHRGTLLLRYTTAALRRSPFGGKVFANGLLAHLPSIPHPRYRDSPVYCNPANRVFLNQDPISDTMVSALIDAHDAVKHRHAWAAGDLLLFDNLRYMHGREMTQSPCERVLISRFGRRASRSPLAQ